MRSLPLIALCLVLALCASAGPIDLRERTTSASRQFQVYSTDFSLRSQVASFAEDVKASVLTLFGEADRWKYPIIITLDKACTERMREAPVDFVVAQVEEGFKVEIDVHVGENPADVNLQKHLVHALLLEFAYRNKPEGIHGGLAYNDPPWWLVEGALQMFRKSRTGVDPDVYKRIIDINKLPSLEQLLADRPEQVGGTTAEAIDQACAMCLLQLLTDQPSGKANLTRFVRHLPDSNGDRVAELLRDFPSLASAQSLQKWWTLNLARLSATDRYQGLSPEETDAQLVTLLQFDIPTGKKDEKKSFGIADFDEYLKLPGSKAVLAANEGAVLSLSTHANALFRSVLTEYQEIFSQLQRGKTHGIKDRLAKVEHYRSDVLKRTSDIADYMNWFEATQMQTRSESFEGYLNAAKDLDQPAKRNDPVSKYLDELATQF